MDTTLPSAHHHPSRFYIFMQIAMALAVITGVEIVIIFVPAGPVIQYTTLTVLSIVKFFAVIFYFMHLRWDKPFCTILFFIGLILGTGTVLGLLALFSEDRTETTADAVATAAIHAPLHYVG